MAICLVLVETSDEEVGKPLFISQYGTLFEDIDTEKSLMSKKYYGVFIIRRFFFAVFLIFLYAYPLIQAICLFVIAILPVIVF